MPTYEYVCEACRHEMEEFQSITAKALRKCPKCGKHKLKRLIGTGAGILFKGSGFYETDYRSDSYKKAAKADKEAASGGKKEGKSDDSKSSSSKSDGGDKSGKSGDSSKSSTSGKDKT